MHRAALIHAPTYPGRVHRVGFGWINIGGRIYEQDRVLHPEGVSSPWWRRPRHLFSLADAKALVAAHNPEHMIVGCGWMGMLRLDAEAAHWLAARGITLDWLRTPQAAARYNQVQASGARIVAALHVTC